MTAKDNPLVSVVIASKNEEENIGSCLESIKRQDYPSKRIEVIVVDNASIDKTKQIARRYTKYVFDQGPERSAQRNFGLLKKARGKYLLCLDADMFLSPTVISRGVKKFRDQTLLGLYVPEIVLGCSYWSRVRRLERSFYDGTAIDCVRMIRADIFRELGGFDLSLTGPEDWDLDKRLRSLGKVAVLDKYNFSKFAKEIERLDSYETCLVQKLGHLTSRAVLYHNETRFNLGKYLSKKYYYSKSFVKYINKWGKKDQDIRKQFGLMYRFFRVFMEKGKWKRLGRYPGLALGIYYLRFLVGVSFLWSKKTE